MKNKKPHIIYILSDEHRSQAMGHMGDPNVKTPAMDQMAREGLSFERACSNCPICTPARGTIFSGRHAHAGPVSGFFDVYKASAPSTATILREAGYHTAYFGKWHCGIVRNQNPPGVLEDPAKWKPGAYGSQRTPERHRAGFQDWRAFENMNQHFRSFYYKDREIEPRRIDGYETDGLTDMVIQYLAEYDREEPLFLVLSVTPPHFPMELPDEWDRFDRSALKVRPNFVENDQFRDDLARYYGMIENLDWNLGRLQDAIKQSQTFSKNTMSVYFSDHGDYMGSHGVSRGKVHIHEESTRIPAIFHWPERIPPQGKNRGLFSLVDMMATTLGLAGVAIPVHNQGTDFSPLIRGEAFDGPEDILVEMTNNPRWKMSKLDWRGVINERWKYAFYETGQELLFDIETDPFEQKNLAQENLEMRDEMRTRLLELLEETRDPYFNVLIHHGVPQDEPDIDVSSDPELYFPFSGCVQVPSQEDLDKSST
ncbi:MAG: sulfatase [Verrucomicrobiota bacterium]